MAGSSLPDVPYPVVDGSFGRIGVKRGRWKIACRFPAETCALYDHGSDPGETVDAAPRAHAEMTRMRGLLFSLFPDRLKAGLAHGKDPDASIKDLVTVLSRHPDPWARLLGAGCLDPLQGKEAAGALLSALASDPSERVRLRAAESLLRGRVKEAVPEVLACIARSGTTAGTLRWLDAAASWSEPRLVGAVRALLARSPEPALRQRAADILGVWKSRKDWDLLAGTLASDPVLDVRASAARALGALGASDSTAALETALSDPALPVRVAASEALAQSRARSAGPAVLARLSVEKDLVARAAMVTAVGKLRPEGALPALSAALDEKLLRFAGAHAIREYGDPAGLDALRNALAVEDNVWTKKAIEKAIETLSR
jgi:HEAT repeat protein